MLMRCCGSSSAGNSYALISSSGEILAIEAAKHNRALLGQTRQIVDVRSEFYG